MCKPYGVFEKCFFTRKRRPSCKCVLLRCIVAKLKTRDGGVSLSENVYIVYRTRLVAIAITLAGNKLNGNLAKYARMIV